METIELSNRLEKFLIEKGLKEQFVFNCEHHGLDDGYVPSNIDGIATSFLWKNTKEGVSFWSKLCEEFYKLKSTPEQPEPEDLHETQKKQILDYLKTGKSITKLEALKMFSIWNSGDAIFNLRKEGYNIETTMITNGKKRFASYKLIENV